MSSENSSSEKLNWVEKQFRMKELGTNVKKETLAGITTFVSMAYILFVNPSVLGASGMDKGAVFTATALSAILGCLLMAFLAITRLQLHLDLVIMHSSHIQSFWRWESSGRLRLQALSWLRLFLRF